MLPIITRDMQGRQPDISSALINNKLLRAFRYFGQDQSAFLLGGFVNVGADRHPETVDPEDSQSRDEAVDEELRIVGEYIGKVRVGVDVVEYGGYEAWLGDFWFGLLAASTSGAGLAAVFGFVV